MGNIFSYTSTGGGTGGGNGGGNGGGGGNVVLADEPTQNDFARVYPNPSDEKIKVEFLENVGEFRLTLINFIGQSIVQSQSNEIDVSQVASGTYFLKIETDKKKALRKVVINH